MKFDGQRYTTIEIDDPIVDPILERGDLKAEHCRGRLRAQLRWGKRSDDAPRSECSDVVLWQVSTRKGFTC